MRPELRSFLLLTAFLFVLNFMGPLALLLPVPFIFYYKRVPALYRAVSAGIVAVLLILIVQDPLAHFVVLFQFTSLIAPFLLFLSLQEEGFGINFSIPAALLLTFILIAAGTLAYPLFFHQPMAAQLTAVLKESGFQPNPDLNQALTSLIHVLPGIIFLSEGIILLLNLMIFSRISHEPINFHNFRLPDMLIALFVAVGLLFIFTGIVPAIHSDLLHNITANTLIALAFAYFMQGLAVAVFFLNRIKMHPLLRLACFIFIFIQPGPFLVTALGFADIWVEFRKRSFIINKK
ncbi:MAG: hypothetical protein DRJ14_08030 [Acidobacteria bacterium]|nr:MAG: hypothetical protein DRJ14_08030 [Acidobacteriota bacterium]